MKRPKLPTTFRAAESTEEQYSWSESIYARVDNAINFAGPDGVVSIHLDELSELIDWLLKFEPLQFELNGQNYSARCDLCGKMCLSEELTDVYITHDTIQYRHKECPQ